MMERLYFPFCFQNCGVTMKAWQPQPLFLLSNITGMDFQSSHPNKRPFSANTAALNLGLPLVVHRESSSVKGAAPHLASYLHSSCISAVSTWKHIGIPVSCARKGLQWRNITSITWTCITRWKRISVPIVPDCSLTKPIFADIFAMGFAFGRNFVNILVELFIFWLICEVIFKLSNVM